MTGTDFSRPAYLPGASRRLHRRGLVQGAALGMAGLTASIAGARLGIAAQDATPAASPASTPLVSAPDGYDSATRDDAVFNASFRHEFLQVDDILMHAVIGGEGPPLVLLHGWPQTWYEWIEVMPALTAHHTVIAIDLPGLGDSVGAPPSYDKRTLARYVRNLVADQLGFDQIDLVAHDLGAGVGYRYAFDYPGEVRRLVYMDYPLPGPGLSAAQFEDLSWHIALHDQPGVAELVIDSNEVRPYLAYFYPAVSPNPQPVSDQAIDEFARTYSQPEKFRGGMELYRTIAQDEQDNLANVGQPLTMPVLMLTGNGAGEFSAATVRPLASDVQLVEVPGAGHWLAEEAPAFVTDQILRFLGNGR